MKKLTTSVLVVLVLAGCAGKNFNFNNAKNVTIGMPEDELIEVIGRPPDKVSPHDGDKILLWRYSNFFLGKRKLLSFKLHDGAVSELPGINWADPSKPLRKVTYTEVIPPVDQKGKECVRDCKKIQLMENQAIDEAYRTERENSEAACEKYSTARLVASCKAGIYTPDLRDTDKLLKKLEYDQCVIDCGGEKVTKTVIE